MCVHRLYYLCGARLEFALILVGRCAAGIAGMATTAAVTHCNVVVVVLVDTHLMMSCLHVPLQIPPTHQNLFAYIALVQCVALHMQANVFVEIRRIAKWTEAIFAF